ncbi:MAG: GUN4 domain-containing protein [Cyanobacteria bacterium P01_H01_bin.162]
MTEQQFDVFLCHNSEDKPAVIEIAQQLQQKSLRPWLDVWELQPGAIWQYALEQQIENIGAAAVFVGQQGLGPWQSEEIYAFLQEFIRRKCPVIPVMLHDAPKQPKLPIFLRNRHWVDYRLQTPNPTVQLIWGITGQRPNDALGTAEVIQTQTVASETEPSTDAAAELAALRQEFERLKSQQSSVEKPLPRAAAPDDLSSEKGIDYTRLRDLLREGKWRDADKETYEVMIRAVGKEPGNRFSPDELQNFPCADLKTIDGLWTKYSNGHFGFSVQKAIWQKHGSPTSFGKKWDQFCIDVGWQPADASRYYKYAELRADPQFSPRGEFP